MKAKEYFKKYKELSKVDGWEVAVIRQFEAMFQEVKEIQKMRNAHSDKALVSIFNEVNKKGNSLVMMINKEEDRRLLNNGFALFIKNQMPELSKIIEWNL